MWVNNRAEKARSFIGKPYVNVASDIVAAFPGYSIYLLKPGCAVTSELRDNRMRVSVDADGYIEYITFA